MKKTEFNLDTLGTVISADSLRALLELTRDLDLEISDEAR